MIWIDASAVENYVNGDRSEEAEKAMWLVVHEIANMVVYKHGSRLSDEDKLDAASEGTLYAVNKVKTSDYLTFDGQDNAAFNYVFTMARHGMTNYARDLSPACCLNFADMSQDAASFLESVINYKMSARLSPIGDGEDLLIETALGREYDKMIFRATVMGVFVNSLSEELVSDNVRECDTLEDAFLMAAILRTTHCEEWRSC